MHAVPVEDDLVLVQGDACAPNTLVSDEGARTGHVDFGDLAVGDRWANLANGSADVATPWGHARSTNLQ